MDCCAPSELRKQRLKNRVRLTYRRIRESRLAADPSSSPSSPSSPATCSSGASSQDAGSLMFTSTHSVNLSALMEDPEWKL